EDGGFRPAALMPDNFEDRVAPHAVATRNRDSDGIQQQILGVLRDFRWNAIAIETDDVVRELVCEIGHAWSSTVHHCHWSTCSLLRWPACFASMRKLVYLRTRDKRVNLKCQAGVPGLVGGLVKREG